MYAPGVIWNRKETASFRRQPGLNAQRMEGNYAKQRK